MGDLSNILPTQTETVQRIYAWHKAKGDAEPARGYLGASIIGNPCDRFLWYTFRGCTRPTFDGRMYRLFETGDLAEHRFVAELLAIWCEVHDLAPDGNQIAVTALGGHFAGHLDAAALGVPEAPKTWHVVECKTFNDETFRKLVKDGVKKAKPKHYAQMMAYMGLTGMTRTLYLAVNKNTDELYSERVRYAADEFEALMGRARRIITANKPPDRIATRADSFACKFCDAYALCWGTSDVAVPIPARTCKACCHATPEVDGAAVDAPWTCAKHKRLLQPTEVAEGCPFFLVIPGLVSFAEPVDAGDDWIEFENDADQAHWKQGVGAELWSIEELMAGPGPRAGEKKAPDPAGPQPPLIEQYPPSECWSLWTGIAAEVAQALDGLGLGDLMMRDPSRREDVGGVVYTEFVDVDGRDILIAVGDDESAAILEGKK